MAKRNNNKKTTRRRKKVMLRVMPMLEAYALTNIATQNLFNGSPLQVLLGDLNETAGSNGGALAQLMGPQPTVLTLKELMMGEYNQTRTGGHYYSPTATGEIGDYTVTGSTSHGSPLQIVSENFKNNFGNIVVGSVLTTAGFRIASKVLSKPKNKMNAMLREANLGSIVQI